MAEANFEIPLATLEPESSCVQRQANKNIHPPNSMTVPSRYLKASTGSCHDFCKYGRKHEAEAKSWVPIRKFIAARRGAGNDQTAVSAESKIKFKISSKNEVLSLNEDLSALEGTDISVVEDPNKPNLKPKHSNSSSLPGHGCPINERNYRTKESKASLEGQNSRISKNRSKEMRTSLPGERKILIPPTFPLSPKPSARRVPSTITRTSQYKTKDAEPEHVPEKILYIVESTIENTTSEPTQNGKHTFHLSPSSTSTTQSTLSSQKSSRYSSSGMHVSQLPPSILSSRNKGLRRARNKTNIAKQPLSSLQSSSSPPLSPTSPSKKPDSKENAVTSPHQTKVVTETKKTNLLADYRIRARRAGKLASENKSSPVQKVKFRRGTILDLKQENNTPRRLKFRRVKFLREIQSGKEDNTKERVKGNVGTESEFSTITKQEKVVTKIKNVESKGTTIKRSLRKKESNESELIGTKTNSENVVLRHQNMEGTTRRRNFRRKDANGSELAGTKMNSVKVVLRHQNVAGKKIVQSLFNNVIEETASKLVESRKSKVKALVGAFETVISLQDSNPSATSDSS
ncbi:uncharacterized protein LOC133830620 [Humulus lupulus]|uniref:uncharacterized protein LOC133830620 n=1 Tax=Humulus lupulus TaxID=3486 RepID=UPI002B40B853|nr:uncharacterized protein LOC133830620 [Humulus lupulus]XP_062116624.1 uncharacterized protein LOC133830620 [Humulus lupulus]XP_062116625.1 uncharacterized protein LOC133830620 [Humulus lupulus]XP_062116626.1 uncharacterized protein LOC133830620 [Humulus lupulus]